MNNKSALVSIFQTIDTFLHTPNQKPKVIVILGPTASGKTALSLILSKKYNGEIISADSRQVYKKMDIATDKLLPDKQQGIKHYLIDLADPDEHFTAGEFKKMSEMYISDILSRNKIPFVVGGTGLYIDVLINNYQLHKPAPDIREKLLADLSKYGTTHLHERLRGLDPISAEKIHPHNAHHLIRSLEIAMSSGKPKMLDRQESLYHVLKIGIQWPKSVLFERINKRVDEQIGRGLVEETKTLLSHYENSGSSSITSLGYSQINRYLKGELSLDQAAELLKKQTRDYARRQITWFKRDKEIRWFDGARLFGD